MDYAPLDQVWSSNKSEEPPLKSRGRRNGGSKAEDDFLKRHNANVRVPPPYPDYALAYEFAPYQMSGPVHPTYAYNRFHGDHLGTPPMQIICPHCQNNFKRGYPMESEMQRMTMYLTFGIFFLLLFDIGTRLSTRLR